MTTCTAARAGIGYYTQHLVDALLETRGPSDELVLLSNRPLAPELAQRWAPYLRLEGRPMRAAWTQTDVPRMLAEMAVDVAVFPNYIVPFASPCPTVTIVHDVALLRMPQLFTLRKRLLMGPLVRQSAASAALVGTVSEASRRDIVAWLGVDPDRIVMLPGAPHPSCGPVPPEELAAVRAAHGLARPYVLTVGTLEPRKGLLTLLHAFDRLTDQGGGAATMDLVVVGGRGWHDKKLVHELGLRGSQGHVRWLGYVSERELVALYGGSEMFVYPSRLEGFGLPVIEAMACGTPVIASDVPALREVAGDAACFIQPGDAEGLATAMARFASDPGAAARAREQGRRRAQTFSWLRTGERLWARAREKVPVRVRSVSRGDERPADLRAAAPTLPPPVGAVPAGLREREWGLLAAVTYADLFDAPLPVEDAVRVCMGGAIDETELRRLVKGPALAPHLTFHPAGYVVLTGREDLVARRQEGAARSAVLLQRHGRMLRLLATLPFVRMLAFSGGTAHQNPGTKPDIDLFVVAAGGHAYTTYSLLYAVTKLTRTRGIVCPNYLIDERELLIAYHHDLFTAHQLISARPISGYETYLALCQANEGWVKRIFPGFNPRPEGDMTGSPRLQRAAEVAFGVAAGPLEGLLRFGWRLHLRRRAAQARTGDVVLADGILKLHLSDYRRRVLDRFSERLRGLRASLASADETEPSATGATRLAQP